jgi:hypothetical protein
MSWLASLQSRAMKFFRRVTTGILGMVLLAVPLPAFADAPPASPLIISQLKITTGNQFITLYNASDTPVDLGTIQLAYFNNFQLNAATSSKLITLSGNLPAHGYVKVNDGTVLMCYQQMVDSASLGLSTKSGLLEVESLSQAADGSVSTVVEDAVAWSGTSSTGLPSYVQLLPTDPVFLQRQTDNNNVPMANGTWQTVEPEPTVTDPCALASVVSGTLTPQPTGNQLLPGTEPPASIVQISGDDSSAAGPHLPPGDIGLMAPEITELLPNPAGTGNDNTNEFIELYNPNHVAFDLSGFVLQVGTTTLHQFTFDDGTTVAPQSFTAFFSADTGLSLSNSGGQAQLLDPLGNAVSQSDVYGTAKDGQAWALADGVWYWTLSSTPNEANIVDQAGSTTGKASGSKTVATANVKGAATGTSGDAPAAAGNVADVAQITPVHPWTLALVALLALLYGLYEYRQDVANRLYQFRKHREARRITRQ